jgi:hypothetical protein
MSYEYTSSGGCARCDAMEGYYDQEPPRPHPNCQCQITAIQSIGSHHGISHQYWYDWLSDEKLGDSIVIMHYQIIVDCCTSGRIVEVGPEGDPTEVELEDHVVQGLFDFEYHRSTGDEPPDISFERELARFEQELEDAFDELSQNCPDPDCLFV